MFFYLIEQHSKFLLHTVKVFYIYAPFVILQTSTRQSIITADMLQTIWSEQLNVTKTWSVVLLNKKNTYTAISSVLFMTSY